MKLRRYLFSRIHRFCGYFWKMGFKKIMIFVKIFERSTLGQYQGVIL